MTTTTTTTIACLGRTFAVRESQSTPGTFNVYLLLTGRGRGQMTWVATALSAEYETVRLAALAAQRRGEW